MSIKTALTPVQRDLVLLGLCPFCQQTIKDWRPPLATSFAPEAWAALTERGIDPVSGHKIDCQHKGVKL